jgi:hypothetical protein
MADSYFSLFMRFLSFSAGDFSYSKCNTQNNKLHNASIRPLHRKVEEDLTKWSDVKQAYEKILW